MVIRNYKLREREFNHISCPMKSYFYSLLSNYLSLYIQPENSVVEVSPQHDHLLTMLPARKAAAFVSGTSQKYLGKFPMLTSIEEIRSWKPDYILLNGNLHYESDIQQLLEQLHKVCTHETRILIVYYSMLWRPLVKVATLLGIRFKEPEQNWIAHEDIHNLLHLSDFEPVRREHHILVPLFPNAASSCLNRFIAPLPFFRHFCISNIMLARPLKKDGCRARPSVSVIIPARNEAGTIDQIINTIPQMGPDDELIFVEGHSTDTTWKILQKLCKQYHGKKNIIIAQQEGRGKGDAVRKGFSLASKDILMIFDADMSVAPEELAKFYRAMVENKGELLIGSRLVYPMEKRSMRFFNILGNKLFALAFSFLLGQRFKDTLCGTKVITRENYLKIAAHRSYFGEFDPFGDFDLIFGASRMGLKILEIPVPYKERIYGKTNIHRWSHGWLLLKMVLFAAKKIKFI